MHPTIHIGAASVSCGLLAVCVASFASLLSAVNLAQRVSLPKRVICLSGAWLLLCGSVGGHLASVAGNWEHSSIFRFDGMSFCGVVGGASVGGVLYCSVFKLPVFMIADVFSPSLAIGDALCRIGCFLEGCCYGSFTTMPWAVRFPNDHSTAGMPVHPTQLYESFINVGIYVTLLLLFSRRQFEGQIFTLYLTLYGTTRFVIEYFRGDHVSISGIFGMNLGHFYGIGFVVMGLATAWILCNRSSSGALDRRKSANFTRIPSGE